MGVCRARLRTAAAFHADDQAVVRVGAALVVVAAGVGARAAVASQADVPAFTGAVDAHLPPIAVVVAAPAVEWIGVLVHAGVTTFIGRGAGGSAGAIVAHGAGAIALVELLATEVGVGVGVHAVVAHLGEAGLALAIAEDAELIAAALLAALSTMVGIGRCVPAAVATELALGADAFTR